MQWMKYNKRYLCNTNGTGIEDQVINEIIYSVP